MDSEEAEALAYVGATIAGRYRLLRLLGAGGMGAVYEAEHVFTKRRVALKRMHRDVSRSRHAAERFIREAQAPSAIGHPGIVQVLDGGAEPDGSLYLVLELLDGVSMQDALEAGALDLPSILQIGIELLDALGAAHAKGFVHRDIKPDNVFLAHDGKDSASVKLLDFGIAAVRDAEGADKLTRTGSILGTPLYMSPEQAQGTRVDGRSDLWAVGAMLYRALAGKAPYDGDTYNALIVSIVTKHHAPLERSRPDLPKALLDAVERAMRKAPGDRFENAEAMCTALRAVSIDRLAADGGGSQAERLRTVARRRSQTVAAQIGEDGPSASRPAAAEPRVAAPAAAPLHRQPVVRVGFMLVLGTLAAGAVLVALHGARLNAREASAQLPAAAESVAPASASAPERASQLPAAAEPVHPAPDHPESEPAASTTSDETTKPASPPQGLPRETLVRVLAAQEPELARCLEEAVVAQLLAGATTASPFRLDVELRVATTGRVEKLELTGEAPPELARCVRARLLATEFPSGAAPTSFRYPVVLSATIVGQ